MTLDQIIDFFCDRMGVCRSKMFEKYKGVSESMTRYMLWHYLHINLHYPASRLSAIFGRNIPSIFRGIRQLRHQMEIYSDIRIKYQDIVMALEAVSDDTASNGTTVV